MNLGIARRHLGDARGARAALERARALAPEQASPLVHLAVLQDAQGDPAAAAALLARARALQPEGAALARQHADLLARSGRATPRRRRRSRRRRASIRAAPRAGAAWRRCAR